jgi:hypothetical protein
MFVEMILKMWWLTILPFLFLVAFGVWEVKQK